MTDSTCGHVFASSVHCECIPMFRCWPNACASVALKGANFQNCSMQWEDLGAAQTELLGTWGCVHLPLVRKRAYGAVAEAAVATLLGAAMIVEARKAKATHKAKN